LVVPKFLFNRAMKANRGDRKHGEGEQPPGGDPGAGQTPGAEEYERDRGGNGPVVSDDEVDSEHDERADPAQHTAH
jgi:hypothetical protein